MDEYNLPNRRLRSSWMAILILLTSLFTLPGITHAQTPAPVPTAMELINAVNAYRASVGLFPLQANTLLLGVSQAQADYMAVSGSCTHSGPDGSRPIDRVYASGYSVGQIIFVSENILCVPVGFTAKQAVDAWATMDELHLNTLTKQQYRNIGAGVTELDGTVYLVLDVAVVAGGKMPTFTPPVPAGTAAADATISPEVVSQWLIPVRTVTPRADGSQVHTVQSGQTLWAIAIAYGVKIAQIVQLNLLATDNPTIYIGQKLLVRAAALTPSVFPTLSVGMVDASQTPTAAAARQTLPTLAIPSVAPTLTEPAQTPSPAAYFTDSRKGVGIALVIVCALGLLLVVLFQRRNT